MEDNKGILYNMGGWSQFFFFCFLSFSGMIMFALVAGLFMNTEQMLSSAPTLRLAQTLQTIFMFLFPSIIFAFFYYGKPKIYLKANNNPNPSFLIFAILLILIIQPLISCLGYYNQQIIVSYLPESFDWIIKYEESAEKSFNLLFSDRSVNGLIFNLLVIAVVAGLAEELFFRGCLQQIMQQIVKNKHAAIWITAIIFSAIHFQFFGFVPRILQGALLGYIFIWSGSIWAPVIVHTVNNAFNVILLYLLYGTPELEQLNNFSFTQYIWYVIPSLVLSCLLLFIIYRKRIISPEIEN
ncbi:CPBP family intramembrane glutamic endopeptidase [Prevotella sp. 10(H)]|uniref:CPBP family intramembrane glutamic endopeptidase n=1 Tax=Prevotella sp. 10(H) TaxID=1158294 RepID=UPI0004A77DB8|nr:CPBP family intramembrane glutamic endopeptidase [Prevotella sp. 10(H)]